MATEALDEPRPSAALKPWQLNLLVVPLVILAMYSAAQWYRAPDYVSLLWHEPLGIKMTIGTAVLLVVGVVVFLGGCALLNFMARVPWGIGAIAIQVGLTVVWVVVFCAPFAYVVTVGPAAIQIQKHLLSDDVPAEPKPTER
jgi:hypothetical protein